MLDARLWLHLIGIHTPQGWERDGGADLLATTDDPVAAERLAQRPIETLQFHGRPWKLLGPTPTALTGTDLSSGRVISWYVQAIKLDQHGFNNFSVS
ncbi:hypothetical protein Pelo_798 [Pelomyxa schiedti]|nr:hypothetical protein Pelo_798 [Pelomyxa schiedti]